MGAGAAAGKGRAWRVACASAHCVLAAATAGCLERWPEPAPVIASRAAPPATVEVLDQGDAMTGRTTEVAAGDTLYAIARREDVAIRSLIEANRLTPPYTLEPGRVLAVPALPEYQVRAGDTVYRISRCTGVDMAALTRLNGIAEPYLISPGQRLRIPPPTHSPECPQRAHDDAFAVAAKPLPAPAPAAPAAEGEAAGPVQAAARVIPPPKPGPVPEPPPRAEGRFLWPTEGRVIARYGPQAGKRQNDGINIAAPQGAAVRAAENGVIVYAGNELRGYGNLLLVRHADGWTSAYAHAAELLVGRGETVSRGQVIARVGQTGNVAEPQLHFELRKGAEAVDPAEYLAND